MAAEASTFTMDEVIDQLGFGRYQRALMLLCGIGWAADIIDVTAMSFLIPVLRTEWNETNERLGLASSFTFFGMLLGSIFWGFTSDRFGRRPSFMMTTLIAAVFGLISSLSGTVWTLVACRFCQGFGLGGNLAVDFSLFMEFVPTKQRGSMTTLLTIFSAAGSMTTAGLAWAVMDKYGWRVFLVLCSAPGLLVAILRGKMQESPHFLVVAGKKEEAFDVVTKVAAINGVPLAPATADQLESRSQQAPPASQIVKRLLEKPLIQRLCGLGMHWFCLSYGFYGFYVWGPTYLELRGFHREKSYTTLFISYAFQIPGKLVASYLVDKVGRRPLLILFSIGCCLSICSISYSSGQMMTTLHTYVLYFNTAALWSLTYAFTPEAFPTFCRTTTMGICSMLGRVAGILVSAVGGALIAQSAGAAMVSYAIAYGVCGTVVFILGIDMTGVPLGEVNQSVEMDELRLTSSDGLCQKDKE